jgi:hypothetical protein
MKRTIITAGVLGLGLISLTAPAMAASDNVSLCHAKAGGGYTSNSIDDSGLHGHDRHGDDIIPPNEHLWGGQNWDAAGIAIHAGGCVAAAVVVPPVVVPPVVPPVVVPPIVVEQPPVVETPAVTPVDPPAEVPAVVVEPPAAAPIVNPPAAAVPASGAVVVPAQSAAAAPQAAPRAAATATNSLGTNSLGTNQGYNAQTAVGGAESSPAWLGGLGALMAAGAAVALRRRSGSSMAN